MEVVKAINDIVHHVLVNYKVSGITFRMDEEKQSIKEYRAAIDYLMELEKKVNNIENKIRKELETAEIAYNNINCNCNNVMELYEWQHNEGKDKDKLSGKIEAYNKILDFLKEEK